LQPNVYNPGFRHVPAPKCGPGTQVGDSPEKEYGHIISDSKKRHCYEGPALSPPVRDEKYEQRGDGNGQSAKPGLMHKILIAEHVMKCACCNLRALRFLYKWNQVERARYRKGQADCDQYDGNAGKEFHRFPPSNARVVGAIRGSKKVL